MKNLNGVFSDLGKKLAVSGYIPGQNYQHCLKMASWHPVMDEFLTSLPGERGSDIQAQNFGYARLCVNG